MKKLLRIFWIFGGIFLFVTLTGSILVSVYKDDIQKYILGYLNDHLDTKVEVDGVEISMLRHFPYISATFRKVAVMSSNPYRKTEHTPDTLLAAGEVTLDVNIYKILIKKEIKVERVLVSDGILRLARAKNGENNWKIFREEKSNRGRKINVRLFRLKETGYRYEDKKGQSFVEGKIEKAEWNEGVLKGRGGTWIKVQQDRIITGSKGKVKDLVPVSSEIGFLLQTGKDTLYLRKGKISADGYPEISFEGAVHKGSRSRVAMRFDAGEMDTEEMLVLLNREKKKRPAFNPGGKVFLNGEIHAEIGSSFSWEAGLNFGGRDHTINIRKEGEPLVITKWTGEGRLRSSGKKVSIGLSASPVQIRYRRSRITGTVTWNNGNEMPVILKGMGSIDLKDANVFFGDGEIFKKGTADPDIEVTVPVSLLKDYKKGDWKKIDIRGGLVLHDPEVMLPGKLRARKAYLRFLPGHLLEITGKDVQGAGSRWNMKGKIYHLDDLIEKRSPVVIRGELTTPKATLERIIGFFRAPERETKKDEINSTAKKMVPVVIAAISADTLLYQDVKVSDLQGRLDYRNPVLDLKDLQFSALEGKVRGGMSIRFLPENELTIQTYGEIEHININRLFRSFHDFNQEFIRAENLKGWMSGNIAFQAVFDSTGKVKPETILSDSYLSLEKGELVEFEPLYKLSRFVRLSELKNIHFSKLENEIFISDSRVVIPEMKIQSSAVDLDIAGTHHFDKHFEYQIRVYLSDYLSRKARKANKDNGLDIVEEPGSRNTSLFLIYKGDARESKVSYDKKRTRQKISGEMKKEKEELKSLFRREKKKEENDSMMQEEAGKKFRVEWPEEEKSEEKEKKAAKDTVVRKKFKVIWEEEPDTIPKNESIYR